MGEKSSTDKDALASRIDTEMYLRDGAPHATVCKVRMKDGRVGIGVHRGQPENYDQNDCDQRALQNAIMYLPIPTPAPGDGVLMTVERQHHEHCDFEGAVDLQASLGHPARE